MKNLLVLGAILSSSMAITSVALASNVCEEQLTAQLLEERAELVSVEQITGPEVARIAAVSTELDQEERYNLIATLKISSAEKYLVTTDYMAGTGQEIIVLDSKNKCRVVRRVTTYRE